MDTNELDLRVEDIEFAGAGKGIESIYDEVTGQNIESDFDMTGDDNDPLGPPPLMQKDQHYVAPEVAARHKPSLGKETLRPQVQQPGNDVDPYQYQEEQYARQLEEDLGMYEEALENILDRHGYQNGSIQTANGQFVNINDLMPSDQAEIISQLIDNAEAAGRPVDPMLTELDKHIRESGESAEEVIEALASQRAQEILDVSNHLTIDHLTQDEVYKLDLQEKIPDLTELELEERLVQAKKMRGFDKEVDHIRARYKQIERQIAQQETRSKLQQYQQERERERKEFVQNVQDIEVIDGFGLDNDTKNYILEDILQTDENGVSNFMRRVNSSPEELFRLAFYANYADEIYQLNEDRVREAYEAGRQAIMKGLRPQRQSAIPPMRRSARPQSRIQSGGQQPPANRELTVDDLWD